MENFSWSSPDQKDQLFTGDTRTWQLCSHHTVGPHTHTPGRQSPGQCSGPCSPGMVGHQTPRSFAARTRLSNTGGATHQPPGHRLGPGPGNHVTTISGDHHVRSHTSAVKLTLRPTSSPVGQQPLPTWKTTHGAHRAKKKCKGRCVRLSQCGQFCQS